MLDNPARSLPADPNSMKTSAPNEVLDRWNALDPGSAAREVLPCCGSRAWAEFLAAHRPFADPAQLFATSDRIWATLPEPAWREAFDSHPRIGQQHARSATAQSLSWSSAEQRTAATGEESVKLALAEGNRQYEEKFGRIFIVCAAGKSAEEILMVLNARVHNTAAAELLESVEQQRQITQLRLRRWLGAD